MLIGYARCSTDAQDLTARHNALTTFGVKANRIYVDHGLLAWQRRAATLDLTTVDACDDSCCPSDAAYTTIRGRSCLVTASARSWQGGGRHPARDCVHAVTHGGTLCYMKTYGVRELRQNTSMVLREVAAGATVEITSNGHPVAQLIPAAYDSWTALIASKEVTPALSTPADILTRPPRLYDSAAAATPARLD